MGVEEKRTILEEMKEKYPGKFAPEEKVFGQINRGDRIFIGTGCGEPQYLVHALVNYVEKHPKAFWQNGRGFSVLRQRF
jgi:acyl-CoA hydrolase